MLDLADILGVPDERPDMPRIVAFLTQMQEGVDMLTEIMVEHKAKIVMLEGEVRLLRARTDPPKRSSSILRVGS